MDRRTVLIGGGAGVGLIVAFALWRSNLSSDLSVTDGERTFGAFLKIGRDGRITIAVPQVETGQGVWTALPQIVADGLGAAWETIAVEPAPLTGAYANPLAKNEGWLDGSGFLRGHTLEGSPSMRITACSTSVRAFWQPLRDAAAVAREMLVGAAADRWNISPDECATADGFVINGGRTFAFGELAEEAADRSSPRDPQPRTGRLVGQSLQRLDGPSKTAGSWRFAADVRLPGMLFASLRIAPPGGQLNSYSRDAIVNQPGIQHITARKRWLAIVADSWSSAERAIHAASPVFSGVPSAAEMRPLFDEALNSGDRRRRFRRGDYDSVVEGSRPLAATYYVAPHQHLDLEPLTATVRFVDGQLELWAPTQAPGISRKRAARAARIGESDVTLYPMPVGGPSGRSMEADAIPYAIELSRKLKRPVQVTLSQAANQNHDLVASGALARMAALPGQSGVTAAWKMEIAMVDGLATALDRGLEVEDNRRLIRTAVAGIPPYAIPDLSIETTRPTLPFHCGYMRGSPEREISFFTESFIDELAHAAGVEPLAFRMSMLGANGRLARCLQGAARLAQWDGGGPGSTMGIAGASAFGSHIGLVANASIGEDQRIKVHRLVAAVDCGQVVSPGLVTQQVQGGLIWAIAQATIAAPEWIAGMPRARPIGGMALPRIGDTPEIVVEIIGSSEAPGGVSGLGTVALAPAVANAIYAGSGKRMRTLPFDPMAA